MSPEKNKNERDALNGQVNFQRVVIIGLIGIIFVLLIIGGFMYTRETTKVVPPEVRRPYEIGADYGSNEYLMDMAGYVLDKVLTVTPDTVDYNNRIILKMTHPDGHGHLKSSLDAAAMRLKKERVTTVWVPQNEKVDAKAKTVEVEGEMKTFIADTFTSQRKKTYLVQFIITLSGRLYVSKIEEVIKEDARTARTRGQS